MSLADFFAYDAVTAPPARKRKVVTLAPVHPNVGIERIYKRSLAKLIDEMERSALFHLSIAYKRVEPEMAMDELSSAAMQRAIKKLVARWNSRFDDTAQSLAAYFAKSMSNRTDAALKRLLKKSGWTVEFKLTRAQRDVLNAIVNENVALIKSIPQEGLAKVQGSVMRSVAAGYDLSIVAKQLRKDFAVTKRRAAFIARDQTKKTAAMLTRVRQTELGITEAIWVHSSAGKEPRPTHLKAGRDKTRYNIAEGWLDPAINKRIWPGTEINCRCLSRPILPELNRAGG